jgi:hypothetical protein
VVFVFYFCDDVEGVGFGGGYGAVFCYFFAVSEVGSGCHTFYLFDGDEGGDWFHGVSITKKEGAL